MSGPARKPEPKSDREMSGHFWVLFLCSLRLHCGFKAPNFGFPGDGLWRQHRRKKWELPEAARRSVFRSDVVESISRFCRRKGIGLCVLTGSGTVADFTIRQSGSTPGATVTFHGRFEILSISATFLPAPMPFQVPNAFKISLVGPQGQVLGGAVVGPLIAAGPVFVIAASFNSPAYNRLPAADEEGNSSVSGSGQSPPVSGHHGGGPPPPNAKSCGMSMYSCHLGPDVIWAPTARPRQAPGPPPPPPY